MKITDRGIAVLENDTNIGRWVQECGELCHDLMVPARIVPLIPVDGVAIDGGANIGDWTIAIANKVGPHGKVIAFEPHPGLFQCLEFNMKAYPWVHCYREALHSRLTCSGMSLDDTNAGGSHLVEGDSVACTTIDMLDLPRLDFLKLDIEGHETNALMGGAATINRCRPIIVLEVNRHCLARSGSSEVELHCMLATLGYKWEVLAGSQHEDHYDVIARPA